MRNNYVGILLCIVAMILIALEYKGEQSHSSPLSDTSMEYSLSGGQIPDEGFLEAEASDAMQLRCDSTVQQLDSYSMELYKKRKAIKIPKSNGAIANQFNDHSPTLPPREIHYICDTVYINSGTVRVTKVIHDTIYLAAPTPNQPTYIK